MEYRKSGDGLYRVTNGDQKFWITVKALTGKYLLEAVVAGKAIHCGEYPTLALALEGVLSQRDHVAPVKVTLPGVVHCKTITGTFDK